MKYNMLSANGCQEIEKFSLYLTSNIFIITAVNKSLKIYPRKIETINANIPRKILSIKNIFIISFRSIPMLYYFLFHSIFLDSLFLKYFA